jgi:hypothetical protein
LTLQISTSIQLTAEAVYPHRGSQVVDQRYYLDENWDYSAGRVREDEISWSDGGYGCGCMVHHKKEL